MHARFFAPGLRAGEPTVQLPADEAEHLVRVLRLGRGADVLVFDGRGRQCAGRVESAGRGGVTVRVHAEVPAAAEPAVSLTLVQALLKGHAVDDIVRDAVMLGVSAVAPLVAVRTAAAHTPSRLAGLADRWRRIAIASAKQCGRAVVPGIVEPRDLAACLRELPAGPRYLLAEPALAAGSAVTVRGLAAAQPPRAAALLVGPEGGWTEEEAAAAVSAGAQVLTLGPRTYRAERAAVIAIAALQAAWGDLEA